ncbi:MAG: prepilin-type N-terminal cleavage/methylation domain-containing protein, partial [Synergistaceae bacterium]|nr:prepilin-type N-terminal cleavage/methylation domain-containing protein [Synergistaceae bacterium]
MKIRFNARRKGMTLAGMMIVIAVIAVLATMMMYSSTEAIATAKATQILTNLQILKRATISW